MKSKTEFIFGYGSLMSYRGLFRNGFGVLNNIKIIDALRSQIRGKRGLAKPASNNICMDIDFFKLEGSLIEEWPMEGYIEGFILEINQKDFQEFCRREGYSKGNTLITYSSSYTSIGEALWNIFQDSMETDYYQSIIEYRKKLRKEINYTSIHYIPHPLKIQDLGYAITFIAPGKYKTGNVYQQSIKKQKGIYRLLNLNEILRREDVNRHHFINYIIECIYGGVHGINIRDIINFISDDLEFLNEVKKHLTKELLIEEKQKFGENIFQDIEVYEQRLGNLNNNLKRSGLESILDFELS